MFIGEAPGQQEDLSGEPFVGQAGQVFDELLESIGLSRSDVYITNLVKSRPFVGPPPGRNRAPTSDEIAACSPWLDEQLAIIRPKVVVTLGAFALRYLIPSADLARVHGSVLRYPKFIVVPSYHPAMARYGRRWTRTLRADFKRLSVVLEGRHQRPEN